VFIERDDEDAHRNPGRIQTQGAKAQVGKAEVGIPRIRISNTKGKQG
jgi:hypothetical protein